VTGRGTATEPGPWDGYASTLVAEAALRAADSGELETVRMRDKPALYTARPTDATCYLTGA